MAYVINYYVSAKRHRHIYKVQAMFGLLSDDDHSEGRMLDVKFIKQDRIKDYIYICFPSPDLQEAVR